MPDPPSLPDPAACVDDDTILRFVQAQVATDEREHIEGHLDRCEDCRNTVAEAARSLAAQTSFPDPAGAVSVGGASERPSVHPGPLLPRDTQISRYRILEPLGMGGAGVVYRAYDPELQREVAIKLIVPDASPGGSRGRARELLVREARAMARLSHANVVNVYDAGTFQGQVFVVMELVPGETLAQWLRARPRSWRDVMEVFVDAGRGLAAAHAAHLVHRDFKPENVLLGPDGRARVIDFGLARPMRLRVRESVDRFSAPSPNVASGSEGAPVDFDVTRFAGTPAYMAPEQFLGRGSDARTDQFSFCVALYLALYGQHPFGVVAAKGEMILALANEVIAGKVRPPPSTADIPDGARDVLMRGLRATPDERYPSMDALLADLAQAAAAEPLPGATAAARRSRVGLSLMVVALAAGGLTALSPRGREWFSQLGGRCGNGVVEGREQCDDSNEDRDDACLPTCRFAVCGDGVIRLGVETCDDSNLIDEDGCTSRCQRCPAARHTITIPETGHCYVRHDEPRTWEEARVTCLGTGTDLVTFTNGRETADVRRKLFSREDATFWTGLHRPPQPPHSYGQAAPPFGWVTGESMQLSYWAADEPSTAGNCVSFNSPSGRKGASKFGEWHARGCMERLPFVCESVSWMIRPQDNHAYRLFTRALDWGAARDACAAVAGHLVTVADADENAFLRTGTTLPFWIGATETGGPKLHAWITDAGLEFRPFPPGEPDRSPHTPGEPRRFCLQYKDDGTWRDRECHEAHWYMCEID